jgi:Phasin protein
MMTTTQQDKPGGKPRQRNRKGEQRKQKGEQRNSPARNPQGQDQVRPMIASTDDAAVETMAAAAAETAMTAAEVVETPVAAAEMVETEAALEMVEAKAPAAMVETEASAAMVETLAAEVALVGEVLPPVPTATGAAEPVESVSLQTIANAYAEYARTSLQESRSLVEKLMAVRSLDRAIELQSEFARGAYTNFVAESQKICGLYGRWVRQIFRPWEVAAAKLTQGGRQPW